MQGWDTNGRQGTWLYVAGTFLVLENRDAPLRVGLLASPSAMMIVVRIFPRGELKESWNEVIGNIEELSSDRCVPLYLSQREEENFMTLIYDVEDIDYFADIVTNSIPSLLHPEKTRTITLLKPVFFPAPKDRPARLERFQVSIGAKPEEVANIFDRIIHLDYPKDAFPTYTAYSFGEDDILTSMLSTSRERLQQFVIEALNPLRGVNCITVGHITRSKRVAPPEMWKKYRESRYAFKPRAKFEEYDFLEYATAPGVPAGETETSSFW